MHAKRSFALKSLFSCFIFNSILIGTVFFASTKVLRGLHQWVGPFLKEKGVQLPEDVQLALKNLNDFISVMVQYTGPVLIGLGVFVTFLLWAFIQAHGRRLYQAAAAELRAASGPEVQPTSVSAEEKSGEIRYAQKAPEAAVQILSILQRQGRLIDFLQEDLGAYDDAQIGAAVRNIHDGCKQALSEHVVLKPVYEESEGSEVTVPPEFDARAIRLTGNVSGDPPFRGVIRHRGWQVESIELPQPTGQQVDLIVAPAEVEVD